MRQIRTIQIRRNNSDSQITNNAEQNVTFKKRRPFMFRRDFRRRACEFVDCNPARVVNVLPTNVSDAILHMRSGQNDTVADYRSRLDYFVRAPVGPGIIDEDPVTGSAHCCLGPYWSEQLGKTEMPAFQASARGGVVQVRIAGDRVMLGGHAVTVMKGTLL